MTPPGDAPGADSQPAHRLLRSPFPVFSPASRKKSGDWRANRDERVCGDPDGLRLDRDPTGRDSRVTMRLHR